jgi:EH domain-containing protein 1
MTITLTVKLIHESHIVGNVTTLSLKFLNAVLEWSAKRVDRIILLFDAHKLHISDEFRRSIEALRGHDDKIRIMLNKADMIDRNN